MDLAFDRRVAVVTGGTSRIGRATVDQFLQEGACVAFCARDERRVEAVVTECEARFGDRVVGAVADIRDAEQMATFRDGVTERFGRVDVLVHNAGASRMATFDAVDDEAWNDELELKFFGLIRPTRAFLPLLRASDAASMVYVSSLLAKQPEGRLISTSAARAGALNLVKSLSLELAPVGVRVNTILLGLIASDQWERRRQERAAIGEAITREAYLAELARARAIPLGRVGTPDEIAAAIVFLASPVSGYTTGAVLEISGGLSRYV